MFTASIKTEFLPCFVQENLSDDEIIRIIYPTLDGHVQFMPAKKFFQDHNPVDAWLWEEMGEISTEYVDKLCDQCPNDSTIKFVAWVTA